MMPERQCLVLSCMLLALLLTGNAQAGKSSGIQAKAKKPDETAAQHFEKGKGLIESNCIDCMGGTQAGMEQGIREIEAALQAGYRDHKAAYQFLSDAYAHMTTYTEKDPEEAKAYSTKRAQIDRKLFELYPDDPEVLQRYESTLQNDAERMVILKRLVKIKPTPDSKFGLGYLLMKQGNVNEGLPLVRNAIATDSNAEAVLSYVGGLIGLLDEARCPLPEANAWQQQAATAFEKATYGAGDPNAMPEFKKIFLAAVDKVNCTIK
jgi:hypothetical protein